MAAFTFKELNKFIHGFTVRFSGLPAENVRQAYRRAGSPFNNIEDSTAYYFISAMDDMTVNMTNRELTDIEGTSEYHNDYMHFRRIRVSWTFYGDENIVDVATAFRGKLMSNTAQSELRAVDLGLILDFSQFNTLPELINDRWFWRVDLRMDMNYYHSDYETVPAIEMVDVGLVPEPTHIETIIGVEDGEITEVDEGSDLYRDIELDIEELRHIAEQMKKKG